MITIVIVFFSSLESAMANTQESVESSLYHQFDGNITKLLQCAKAQQQLVIVSHRGGMSEGFPENALASARAMQRQVPSIIEVDISSSKDGVDFLHHDLTLDRTTTLTGNVTDHTWHAIKAAKLRDETGAVTDFHPISFTEFLANVSQQMFLMIDLKFPHNTQKIVRQVSDANMLKSSIFIAYNPAQAKQVLAQNPQALVALGLEREQQLQMLTTVGLLANPVVALSGELVPHSDFFNKLANQGHFVLVGTYLGEPSIESLISQGNEVAVLDNAAIDGVVMAVSNQPHLIANYLVNKQKMLLHCI